LLIYFISLFFNNRFLKYVHYSQIIQWMTRILILCIYCTKCDHFFGRVKCMNSIIIPFSFPRINNIVTFLFSKKKFRLTELVWNYIFNLLEWKGRILSPMDKRFILFNMDLILQIDIEMKKISLVLISL